MGVQEMTSPLVLIQARINSTRLYNKINQLIGNKRMVDHVVDRVRKAGLKWMFARPQDWPEVEENDVLGRLYTMCHAIDPEGDTYDPIVRITADCPMLDTGIMLTVLDAYNSHHGGIVATGPEWDGMDAEVFSRTILARAHTLAGWPYDREHVTPWMKWHESTLILHSSTTFRWSVDDAEGLEFVREVFRLCPHCYRGVPHHTNARTSISGGDRELVIDLHAVPDGGLDECLAADLLRTRTGGPVYVSG